MTKADNSGTAAGLKANIRWSILTPALIFFIIAAVIGIIDNQTLTTVCKNFFSWSLDSFGWLYQWVVLASFVLVCVVTFSKAGNIRFGGKEAKPKYSMATWFAMALTGGIATGVVTWGVNEPIIYYGNVWGELKQTGITPFTPEAARFAMGRVFYNWTFVPYAIYAISGTLVAYLYFNRKEKLNVTATLKPLFGERITKGVLGASVDLMSMMAIGIGMTAGLTMCLTLLMSGLKGYGINDSLGLFIGLGIFTMIFFTFSTSIGLDRGLKVIGSLNAWFYYALIALFLFTGPVLFIFRNGTAGMGLWISEFFSWGLDPIDVGGEALTKWWTLFNWAFWVAYAPVTAIFLALLSYGRTIREFMLVNWVLPSVFGVVWFSVWGNTALDMQISGGADLVKSINEGGAVMALWEFLRNLPFGLGTIVIPFNLVVIFVSFTTAADATLVNIGSMCMKNVPIGTEPPAALKILWGVLIGIIAIVMAAFGGGAQGVDGVKQLAVAGGFFVLFIFALQLVSVVKVFFYDEIVN